MDGYSALFRCCGGEVFVHLPTFGFFHVPTTFAVAQLSLALPILAGAFLVCLCVAWLPLRGQRFGRSLAVAVSAVLMQCFIHGPFLSMVVAKFDNPKSKLRDLQAEGVEQPDGLQSGFVLPAEEARAVSRRVLGLRSHWDIALGAGYGTPHMTLGTRYGGLLFGGHMKGTFERAEELDELLQGGFHDLYERIPPALSRALGAPVRLRTDVHMPAFLIWLPNSANAVPTDLHRDGSWSEHLLQGEDCRYHEQQTLILPLQLPTAGGENGSGLSLWEYRTEGGQCTTSGQPQWECAASEIVPYREGVFVMFPSSRFHASAPWRSAPWSLDPRILMVGFVVPCHVEGGTEYQLIGALGR